MKKVICIDDHGFSLITEGRSYDVVNESRDFYYIVSNSGVERRYGKSRFRDVVEETDKTKPIVQAAGEVTPKVKPTAKPKGIICKIPKGNVVTYNNVYYPIGESKLKDKWILNVNGKEVEVLKSRFVSE